MYIRLLYLNSLQLKFRWQCSLNKTNIFKIFYVGWEALSTLLIIKIDKFRYHFPKFLYFFLNKKKFCFLHAGRACYACMSIKFPHSFIGIILCIFQYFIKKGVFDCMEINRNFFVVMKCSPYKVYKGRKLGSFTNIFKNM